MLAWIIGAGGLLGSSVQEAARAAGASTFAGSTVPWADERRTVDVLEGDLRAFERAARDEPWAIAWCAGSAVVSSSDEQTDRELGVLVAFLESLGANLPAGPGVFFLASSAGGVYAGSTEPPFDEDSVPHPLSPYGQLKLRQEGAVVRHVGERVPVVIGRLSNLYGPRADPMKGQGLIPLLCRASLLREPLNLYVSTDTLRDYLYVDDAGSLVWAAIEDALNSGRRGARIEVMANGQATTIAQVVATVQGVAHRKVPLALGTHPSSRHQVVDLRLTPSRSLPTGHPATDLPIGVKRVLTALASEPR